MAKKTGFDREVIAKDWLPRYTGMPLEEFGDYILLTNFSGYVDRFADKFKAEVYGRDKPMQACSNQDGVCLLYTSPSPRDKRQSRMPSSA